MAMTLKITVVRRAQIQAFSCIKTCTHVVDSLVRSLTQWSCARADASTGEPQLSSHRRRFQKGEFVRNLHTFRPLGPSRATPEKVAHTSWESLVPV